MLLEFSNSLFNDQIENNNDAIVGDLISSIISSNDFYGHSNVNDVALKGSIVASVLLIGAVGGFSSLSYLYREHINGFLI